MASTCVFSSWMSSPCACAVALLSLSSRAPRLSSPLATFHRSSSSCSLLSNLTLNILRESSTISCNASFSAGFQPEKAADSWRMDEIVPAVIVGGGRLGLAFERMGGGVDVVVRRGVAIPTPFDRHAPIIVCTRTDSLDSVVDITPPSRRNDLVFVQNGMLEPWLEARGISHATQVLVYFAVDKLGQSPVDGKTDLNPEGLTAVFGKWAAAIANRLHRAGLSCKVLDAYEFQKRSLEKLIWISAFMLVGARHPGSSVGEVEKKYSEEVCSLIKELASAASIEKGVEFDVGIEERLRAYAQSVAHFPTAMKEFEWRNGWFYSLSKKALALGSRDPCPLHSTWLRELGMI